MVEKAHMMIGTIARLSGLSAKTIRYYEEIGLVTAPCRTEAGYRLYADTDLHILTFVCRARDLGFGLNETAGLLQLWRDRARSSAEVRSIATERLAEMDRKLSELEGLKSALSQLVASCAGDERPDCPILDALVDCRH